MCTLRHTLYACTNFTLTIKRLHVKDFILRISLFFLGFEKWAKCLAWLFIKKGWKVCQNSDLPLFLATSTRKMSSCQRIYFFEYFFTFLYFFEKTVKMAAVSIRWKWSNFSKLSNVMRYNHYLCTLKWFL